MEFRASAALRMGEHTVMDNLKQIFSDDFDCPTCITIWAWNRNTEKVLLAL